MLLEYLRRVHVLICNHVCSKHPFFSVMDELCCLRVDTQPGSVLNRDSFYRNWGCGVYPRQNLSSKAVIMLYKRSYTSLRLLCMFASPKSQRKKKDKSKGKGTLVYDRGLHGGAGNIQFLESHFVANNSIIQDKYRKTEK